MKTEGVIVITLNDDRDNWLAHVIIDNKRGTFAIISEYGNFAASTRCIDLAKELIHWDVEYFGNKLFQNLFVLQSAPSNKKLLAACLRCAEKVLPALQQQLKKLQPLTPKQ